MQSAEFHACPPRSASARMMRKSILRKMESWHRELFETAPDAIVAVGAGGAIVLVSPRLGSNLAPAAMTSLGSR